MPDTLTIHRIKILEDEGLKSLIVSLKQAEFLSIATDCIRGVDQR